MSGVTSNSLGSGRSCWSAGAIRHRGRAGIATVLASAIIGITVAMLPSLPASAQLSDTESLINRLIRLEREVQTLNLQVYRGEPAPALEPGTAAPVPEGYAAQFEVRLSQIERQLRDLTGQMEQSQFSMRQINERLDRALTDIEYRLTLLEGGEPPEPGTVPYASTESLAIPAPVPAPATQAPTKLASPSATDSELTALELSAEPAPAAPAATVPEAAAVTEPLAESAAEPVATAMAVPAAVELPPGNADTQYDYAYGLLAQGDYDRAEQALTMFADSHPDNPLTSNARYWLGETYYVRGQFDDAAIAFAQGYQSFPDGAKAVDSLLKLGMALAAAGNRNDACLTLNQLDVEFPNAPTGIKRRATQERSRLQCI